MRRSPRIAFSLLTSLSLILGAASVALGSSDRGFTTGTEVLPIFRGHVEHARPSKPGVSNLMSKGGPIQQVPKVYISYWGPEWAGGGFTTGGYTSAQAQTYNNDFFSNVGGSGWNNVVKQYCMGVASGTQTCPSSATFITNPTGQLKGTWNDTTAVPSSPTQTDIANAAARLVAHFSGGTPDPNATYMVYTPSGKSMSGFATSWCAWHSWATVSGVKMAYAYIPYMPDAGSSCGRNFRNSNNSYGNGWFDGFSIVAGHEYSEAETDPFPSSGWVDRQGAENADKCAWSSASANITLGAHVYTVQPTWSNATGGCAMSAS
jgi:serine protease